MDVISLIRSENQEFGLRLALASLGGVEASFLHLSGQGGGASLTKTGFLGDVPAPPRKRISLLI